jgi:hypothetical protein
MEAALIPRDPFRGTLALTNIKARLLFSVALDREAEARLEAGGHNEHFRQLRIDKLFKLNHL